MNLIYNDDELNIINHSLEQIVFSKEIRRLKSKTQLYSVSIDDHYRNRMTHTLEVVTIAKDIARKANNVLLRLFELSDANFIFTELIEAIGLAHDIGHTPFGHVGERTIQSILKRDDSLGGLIYDNDFKTQLESNDGLFYKEWIKKTSFFKHNVNSVELLIQNNVTYWKILDGVLQHTDVTYDNKLVRVDVSELNWLKLVLKNTELYKKYFSNQNSYINNFSLSLEGQIIAIADEIAQLYSDLDDTLRYNKMLKLSNILNIKCEDKDESSMRSMNNKILKAIKNGFIDDVINTFEQKVRVEFKDKIYEEKIKMLKECQELYFYFEKNTNDLDISNYSKYISRDNYINFDNKSTYFKIEYIKFIKKKYSLKNIAIRKSDGKSKYIIRQLFKAYYNNPELLDDKVINKIKNEYANLCKRNDDENKKFRDLIKEMKLNNNNIKTEYYQFLIGNILLKEIAKYISYMTDDYALAQYQELYLS